MPELTTRTGCAGSLRLPHHRTGLYRVPCSHSEPGTSRSQGGNPRGEAWAGGKKGTAADGLLVLGSAPHGSAQLPTARLGSAQRSWFGTAGSARLRRDEAARVSAGRGGRKGRRWRPLPGQGCASPLGKREFCCCRGQGKRWRGLGCLTGARGDPRGRYGAGPVRRQRSRRREGRAGRCYSSPSARAGVPCQYAAIESCGQLMGPFMDIFG